MTIKLFFLLLLLLSSSSLLAQEVNFRGSVTRHQLSDHSVDVRGEIYIRYGRREGSVVAVPYLIPANRSSTNYSKSVDWSLAGSEDSNFSHDYFVIELSCITNCAQAKLTEKLTVYNPSGVTSTYQFTVEKFGEAERVNNYIVNLTMLPNYGVISGRLGLPDGKIAKTDIELDLLVADFIRDKFGNVARVLSQKVKFRSGTNIVDFDFIVGERIFPAHSVDGFTRIGYSCESSACSDHNLLQRGWLKTNSKDLTTNDGELTIQFERTLEMTDLGDFELDLSTIIKMLSTENVSVEVLRPKNGDSQHKVVGRLIVEKSDTDSFCSDSGPDIPELINTSAFTSCQDFGDFSGNFRNVVISETPFSMDIGVNAVDVAIVMEPMNQLELPVNPSTQRELRLESQSIRFECDSGCEQRPYQKFGYFSGFDNPSNAKTFNSAFKFFQTSNFFEKNIQIVLGAFIMPPSILYLLLNDDEFSE